MKKILWLLVFVFHQILPKTITLSKDQIHVLGKRIWQSECNGTIQGLTFWNVGEAFPSLGIGHFIWYPQGTTGPFKQTFPDLILFLIKNNVTIPEWLKQAIAHGCPWKTRDIFLTEKNSLQMNELRTLLANTIDLQAQFIISQFETLFNEIITNAPSSKRQKLMTLYERLSKSAQGMFALIDYVHFKGAGIHTGEQYKGKGWGLLQVLEAMDSAVNDKQLVDEFVNKAKHVLHQRVANSPQRQKEEQWLPGWINRVQGYTKV